MPESESLAPPNWATSITIEPEHMIYWRVGPLTLRVERRREEWRVWSEIADDQFDEELDCPEPEPTRPLPDRAEATRIAAPGTENLLTLSPALADRAVVIRPGAPFRVLAQGVVSIFLSTPLWIRLEVGGARELLYELPTFRPSDTWFGPTPREGELCYVSRTRARVDPDAVRRRPARAITEMTLRGG